MNYTKARTEGLNLRRGANYKKI